MRAALVELSRRGVEMLAVSRFFATPAWPDPSEPSFVNAVSSVRTELLPNALLEQLHATEQRFGRERGVRNAPRTLDLDILDYEGRIEFGSPELPHPRLDGRAFVLIPMRDIAPDWRHPATGKSLGELIAALPAAERKGVKPLREV
jgi:2-amino-4-hydroxy-6-hydroxymethyldihydropteridine diphosphokinase